MLKKLALAICLSAVVAAASTPASSFAAVTERLRADSITAEDGWPKDIPPILSEHDVKLYKKLFDYQRRLRHSQILREVPMLENQILLGHLRSIKILHPLTRAKYSELKDWMERYNDLGPANEIWELANRRAPNGATHPAPLNKQPSLARYSDYDEDNSPEAVARTKERTKLLRRLKYYRRQEQFQRAQDTLLTETSKDLLGLETWGEVGIKLARTMLYSNQADGAEQLATTIDRQLVIKQPAALWVAGFAAYKQGQPERAVRNFRKLAYAVPPKSKYYSRAAWWAARCYEDMGKDAMTRVFLNMAARNGTSFYGLLATEKLGRMNYFRWRKPRPDQEVLKRLITDAGVRRVIALAQIGEYALAQQELKTIYERIPYEADATLLALSMRLNLAGASLTLSRNLKERKQDYLSGQYPLLEDWIPEGHIKIDPALVHAIIRQESAFNPTATSHVGARGLMQLMPDTARYIQKKTGHKVQPRYKLFEPQFNTQLGQDYLIYLTEKIGSNLIAVIASYNAGPSNVEKWLARSELEVTDPILFIESIPFKETRNYVMKVMANYWLYRHQFGADNEALASMAHLEWPKEMLEELPPSVRKDWDKNLRGREIKIHKPQELKRPATPSPRRIAPQTTPEIEASENLQILEPPSVE